MCTRTSHTINHVSDKHNAIEEEAYSCGLTGSLAPAASYAQGGILHEEPCLYIKLLEAMSPAPTGQTMLNK